MDAPFRSSPNNPILNFMPIARRVLNQSDLEYYINQRPYGDICFKRRSKGQFTTRFIQQQNQQQEEDNEFDGIQLLWTETDSVNELATPQPSEQLNF